MTMAATPNAPTRGAGAQSDTIESQLFEIIQRFVKSPDARLAPDTTMEEAQIDSLDLVELVFEIEERFGVEINFNANDRPVGELTFGDVVGLIRAALNARGRTA